MLGQQDVESRLEWLEQIIGVQEKDKKGNNLKINTYVIYHSLNTALWAWVLTQSMNSYMGWISKSPITNHADQKLVHGPNTSTG